MIDPIWLVVFCVYTQAYPPANPFILWFFPAILAVDMSFRLLQFAIGLQNWPIPGPLRALRQVVGRLLHGARYRDVVMRMGDTSATFLIGGVIGQGDRNGHRRYRPSDHFAHFALSRLEQLGTSPRPDDQLSFYDLPVTSQREIVGFESAMWGNPIAIAIALVQNPSILPIVLWARWTNPDRSAPPREKLRGMTEGRVTSPDELVTANAEPTIYLAREWPPGNARRSRSYFGGRPCLPAGQDWPRHPKLGLSLHFLAQIDCADLPDLGGKSPLPRDGQLLFFANLDQERLYDDDSGDGRVIYVKAKAATRAETTPPDDLPEIDHLNGKQNEYCRQGFREFPRWPVTAHAAHSWRHFWDNNDPTGAKEYWELRLKRQRDETDAILGWTGQKSHRLIPFEERVQYGPDGKALLYGGDRGIEIKVHEWVDNDLTRDFPWCEAVRHAVHDEMTARHQQFLRRRDMALRRAHERKAEGAEAERLDRLAKETAAQLADFDGTPSSGLGEWIKAEIARQGYRHPRALSIQEIVSEGILHAIRRAAGDSALAAQLPAGLVDLAAPALRQTSGQWHMMLGAPQSRTNQTGGRGIRLLCLDTDPGPGFVFCDGGVVEYWIDPGALRTRRFDKAYALTAGG